MNQATPEDYLREEAINDLEKWKINTDFQLSTGCWVDSRWGHYGVARLIDVAQDLGMEISDLDESAVWAYRNNMETFQDEVTGEYHSSLEWMLMHGGLADDAENWLNENIAKDEYYFGWEAGEFFYMHLDWWKEGA